MSSTNFICSSTPTGTLLHTLSFLQCSPLEVVVRSLRNAFHISKFSAQCLAQIYKAGKSCRVFSVTFADRGAFARNEDLCGRFDAEFLRVIALVDGDADAPARILIKKRIADGNIHERFAEGKDESFSTLSPTA